MTPSNMYVGVQDPSGAIVALPRRSNSETGVSHTHLFLVDTLYRGSVLAVRAPREEMTDLAKTGLKVRKTYWSDSWYVVELSVLLPSDHLCIIAEHVAIITKAEEYKPRIAVPLRHGDCIPFTRQQPYIVPAAIDSVIGNLTPKNYVRAESIFDVATLPEMLKGVCPLLYRCLTSPGLITSSDMLFYAYYSIASHLTGLPVDSVIRSAIRTALPKLDYVPTCTFLRAMLPNVCQDCTRCRNGCSPLDVLAAVHMTDRIVNKLTPQIICDTSLEEIADTLDPVCRVDSATFSIICVKAGKHVQGTPHASRKLTDLLTAYRTYADSHPVRRLVEAYRVQQHLSRMEASDLAIADIILQYYADDGAKFYNKVDGCHMIYHGSALQIGAGKEYDAWLFEQTGVLTGIKKQALTTALLSHARRLASAGATTGFGLYRYQDMWYIYQGGLNEVNHGWRDALTMAPVDLDVTYLGPKTFDWIEGVTLMGSLRKRMTATAQRLGFDTVDFEHLTAFMASSLYLQHLPAEWSKPMYVVVPNGSVAKLCALSKLISALFYGEDKCKNLTNYTMSKTTDLPITIAYAEAAPAKLAKKVHDQLTLFVVATPPTDIDCYCVTWHEERVRATPEWFSKCETAMREDLRPALLASFAAIYRDIGFSAVMSIIRDSETPHLQLIRLYAHQMCSDYKVTRSNAASSVPGLLYQYWAQRNRMPYAVRITAATQPSVEKYRLPRKALLSTVKAAALELGYTVDPAVTQRLVATVMRNTSDITATTPDAPMVVKRGIYQGTQMLYLHFTKDNN